MIKPTGVFIARGKEDALVTKNMVTGEAVYGEKRISVGVSHTGGSVGVTGEAVYGEKMISVGVSHAGASEGVTGEAVYGEKRISVGVSHAGGSVGVTGEAVYGEKRISKFRASHALGLCRGLQDLNRGKSCSGLCGVVNVLNRSKSCLGALTVQEDLSLPGKSCSGGSVGDFGISVIRASRAQGLW